MFKMCSTFPLSEQILYIKIRYFPNLIPIGSEAYDKDNTIEN